MRDSRHYRCTIVGKKLHASRPRDPVTRDPVAPHVTPRPLFLCTHSEELVSLIVKMYTSEDIEVQLKQRGIVILSRPSTSQSEESRRGSRGGSRSGDHKRSGENEMSGDAGVQDVKKVAQAKSGKEAEGDGREEGAAEQEEVDEEELERRAMLAKELGAKLSEDELREVGVLCVVTNSYSCAA